MKILALIELVTLGTVLVLAIVTAGARGATVSPSLCSQNRPDCCRPTFAGKHPCNH